MQHRLYDCNWQMRLPDHPERADLELHRLDEEIEPVWQKIISSLEGLGGKLRDRRWRADFKRLAVLLKEKS